ncbi:MAG: GNAT family N-acetyltransferase [Gammaproteobacteria bacterium]|nr:GNAT family N-acetyltransferase [Gammaproteobacteria bacterium]
MSLKLHTDRLTLAPLELTDVDLAIDLWTDPEVVRYICEVQSEAELREDMPDAIRRGGNGCIGIWCISDRLTGRKLGSTYLLPMPTEDDDVDYDLIAMGRMPDTDIEVGYFLTPSAWGQGYATEVCKRILRFAFQESPLNELVASIDENNAASKHVLEKSGFRYFGRTLCWGKDGPIYKISRDEWTEIQRSA